METTQGLHELIRSRLIEKRGNVKLTENTDIILYGKALGINENQLLFKVLEIEETIDWAKEKSNVNQSETFTASPSTNVIYCSSCHAANEKDLANFCVDCGAAFKQESVKAQEQFVAPPGIPEKSKTPFIILNKENNALINSTSESDTTANTSQSSNDPSTSKSKPKNSFKKVYLVLGILGAMFAVAVIYFSFNKNKFNNNPIGSTIEQEIIVDEGGKVPKLKSIDDKDWKLEKSNKIVFSNNSEYLVTMSSKKGDEDALKFKLSIYRIENNQSQLSWESNYNEGFAFESLEILNTNKSAIIAGVYNLGGAHALNEYYVVSLSESGIIESQNILEQYGYIEKSNNSLIIVEEGQKVIFKATNNEIIRSIETKDANQALDFNSNADNINNSSNTLFFSDGMGQFQIEIKNTIITIIYQYANYEKMKPEYAQLINNKIVVPKDRVSYDGQKTDEIYKIERGQLRVYNPESDMYDHYDFQPSKSSCELSLYYN